MECVKMNDKMRELISAIVNVPEANFEDVWRNVSITQYNKHTCCPEAKEMAKIIYDLFVKEYANCKKTANFNLQNYLIALHETTEEVFSYNWKRAVKYVAREEDFYSMFKTPSKEEHLINCVNTFNNIMCFSNIIRNVTLAKNAEG